MPRIFRPLLLGAFLCVLFPAGSLRGQPINPPPLPPDPNEEHKASMRLLDEEMKKREEDAKRIDSFTRWGWRILYLLALAVAVLGGTGAALRHAKAAGQVKKSKRAPGESSTIPSLPTEELGQPLKQAGLPRRPPQ